MREQQLFVETELIRQAQNGNSAAYGELYTRHLLAIQHYIQKRIRESSDAEDLTQTVFVKAWQALRDYQPSGAPFRAWLYRIAHNAVIDYYRAQRPYLLWDDLVGMSDPQDPPELQVLATEQQETVRTALANLRPSYQAVLVRRFLQNLNYNETAADLGQQVNHVRVVQHRALDALRRVLTHDPLLWLATTVTIMTLLFGGKIVVAAEQALPGDRLYSIRTWAEATTLLLADDATDVRLHTGFATQRLSGLGALYQQGRRDDLAAAVAAAAVHIRTASTQLTQVTASERTRLTPPFAAALQNQRATLQTFAQADPQTLPALQPALLALTAAQDTLSATKPVAPPIPTLTPSATATRTLLPTPTPPPAVVAPTMSVAAADAAIAAATPTSPAMVAPREEVPIANENHHTAERHATDSHDPSTATQPTPPQPTHDLAAKNTLPAAPTLVAPSSPRPAADAAPDASAVAAYHPVEPPAMVTPPVSDETVGPSLPVSSTPAQVSSEHDHTASPMRDQETQQTVPAPHVPVAATAMTKQEQPHPESAQDETTPREADPRSRH